MPVFVYTGEDKEGKRVKETVTADDRYAVYETARQNGHRISSIEEDTKKGLGRFLNMEAINAKLSRVKNDELIMMTRNLGSMLTAGLTVTRALSVMERQSTNPKMRLVLSNVVASINNGVPFYDTLKNYPEVFNDLYKAMVRSGEESGNLAESLKTLSIQMERANNLTKKIKGAMIYPSIVLSIMVVIGVLMMTFVMPKITSVFKSMTLDLPITTVFLIKTSDFFAAHTILVMLMLIGGVMGTIYFFKSRIGKRVTSFVVVRLPLIGTMAKETNSARTARTLASLLNSGVSVIQALEITEEVVQNHYYKEILRDARTRVEKGTPLSQAFVERTDLYPILVGEMILVGEETGQIAGMLGELAIFYETEVERKTKDLSTIIEPLLMVVIGAGVGFFALAMIAPIYSISDGLK